MKAISPDVFGTTDAIAAVGEDEIGVLEQLAEASTRKVSRLCTHASSEEALHEMLIVHWGRDYVRPTKHSGSDESLHVLKGRGELVLFSEEGAVTDVVALGERTSGHPFYVRIPATMYHALVVKSECIVFHECINGPFRQGARVFAPWSPEVGAEQRVEEFMARVSEAVRKIGEPRDPPPLKMKRVNDEVFFSEEDVARVGPAEIDLLKRALAAAPRKRARICTHRDPEARLQEMFIAFAKGTFLPPGKHLGHDNSVNVLEGRVDVVFFDNDGGITDVVSLGEKGSGLPFYLRTPSDRWHGWLLRSETLVVHETTDGPFRVENSLSAPWAPRIDDPAAAARYESKLAADAAHFSGAFRSRELSARA